MNFLQLRYLVLLSILSLPACVTQGYHGSELPQEQVAKVSLAAPLSALLPPFWIFPLTMVPRRSEDWRYTVDYEIKVDDRELNRFNSVTLLPGEHNATAKRRYSTDELIQRLDSSSYTSCSTDKKGNTQCTTTTNCYGLFKVTHYVSECELNQFKTEPGHIYELLMSKDELILRERINNKKTISPQCGVHVEKVSEASHEMGCNSD